MKAKTLIALLLVVQLCQLSQSSRKSRHYRNGNVKKSFLADAMNEMEYGSAHPPSDNKTDTSKLDPNRIVSIRRIYPSNIVNAANENNKPGMSSAYSTPNLINQPSNTEDKSDDSKGQANISIAPSGTGLVASATASKDVSNAINLLKSFVKKLLTQNSTEPASLNQSKIATDMFEKKDTFKEKGIVDNSTIDNKMKYNLTAVFQLRTKQTEELLNRLKEEEEKLRHNLLEKQHEIEELGKVEEANSDQPRNSTTSVVLHENNINTVSNPTSSVQTTKAPTPISKNAQNDTNEAQFKFDSLKGIPPELLVKLKEILDKKKQKKLNAITKQQDSSRKAFETAKKLVKAAFAREQLYKAEKDFFEKVKEMMNKTSEANLLDNKNTTNLPQGSGDEAEREISSVKDYIHSLEAEQKVVESVERRTQPTPKTTDIEAFQSASNRLSPTSEIENSSSTLSPSAQSSNYSSSNQLPVVISKVTKTTANQSLTVASAAIQSKLLPAFVSTTTKTKSVNQAQAVQSTSNQTQPAQSTSDNASTEHSTNNQLPSNSTVANPGQIKLNPGNVQANGKVPIQSILNNLNRTKGPDEKSVEAAAHLEEKVAEQQDEMYEDLLRHTLNKGRLNDDDDDDDYEDEEAATRDRAGRPLQYGQIPQENYGDFQDSDERAHARSEVIDEKHEPKLHYIDENAIFSLKKNYISRPPKQKTSHTIRRKPGERRSVMRKHF